MWIVFQPFCLEAEDKVLQIDFHLRLQRYPEEWDNSAPDHDIPHMHNPGDNLQAVHPAAVSPGHGQLAASCSAGSLTVWPVATRVQKGRHPVHHDSDYKWAQATPTNQTWPGPSCSSTELHHPKCLESQSCGTKRRRRKWSSCAWRSWKLLRIQNHCFVSQCS